MIEDLIHGWGEMQRAAPGYEAARRYYEGNVDEVFSSARIRALVGETGLAYRFNLAKTPVDILADRVELRSVTAPDQQEISARIEQVWDANDLDVHYPDLLLKAFEFGDAYMHVVLLDERPDDTLDEELEQVGVEMIVHSPLHSRMIYDPENMRRKLFFIKRWQVPGKVAGEVRWRVDLWYADTIERWISKSSNNLEAADGWEEYLGTDEEDEDWLIANPYGEIPFFHYRTDLPYGKPVHLAGYGCQDAVNKALVTQLTTMDSHGWPQRYKLTDEGAELEQNGDGPDFDDDLTGKDSSALVGGTSSALRSGPGTVWDLTGTKAVGQFAAADPGNFLDPASFYVRLMAQLTGTPLHYFDPSGDVPSGESLKTADAPMAKKADRMKVMFRGAVVETWQFSLRLLNLAADRLDVRWAPTQVATGTEDWNVIETKQRAGVPQAQTLVEAGYESEQVKAWLDQESDAMDLTRRITLLNSVADAIQKLGAGVGLGVLDEVTAQAIIAQMVPQVAPPPGTEEMP